MRLFEIDENDLREVKLNRVWLWTIPEFAEVLRRDKGSEGDSDGRRKLRSRKEFTYIYHMIDFASPLRDWEESEKHKEALYYSGLEEKAIDKIVLTAKEKYKELFLKAARSLRTYIALQKTLDAMDNYYENLDFELKDKKGELLHNPLTVANSVDKLDKMHTAVANFAKRVEEELSQGPSTIRGAAELGDMEGKKKDAWSESDIAHGSDSAAGEKEIETKSFKQLGMILNGTHSTKPLLPKQK